MYQQISVDKSDLANQFSRFSSFDPHTVVGWEGRIYTVLSREDVQRAIELGLELRVEIDDLSEHYQNRAHAELVEMEKSSVRIALSEEDPQYFRIGSAGGAYTLEEADAILDSMAILFPDLVTSREIGKSVEGRPLRLISVSAPDQEVEQIPILYTGLHHAREPVSATVLVYTMWSLLEGYGVDSSITNLLTSRRLDFVPVVNPDGYQKNLVSFPQGGGLWRKNVGADGNGVDLNRNYGPEENWMSPNDGDNLHPSSLNYRGPTPFSEPETAAMRDLMASEDYAVILHHHAFGELLLMDHRSHRSDSVSDDWRIYSARELSKSRGLGFGLSEVAIGYRASGSATRWTAMSPELRGYAWTPETGNMIDGFWPLPSRYLQLARETHQVNLSAARSAGAEIVLQGYELQPDRSVQIKCVNSGIQQVSDSTRVTLGGKATWTLPPLRPAESIEFTVQGELAEEIHRVARSIIPVSIETSGVRVEHDLFLFGGIRSEIFADDFESGLASWDQDLWGVESVDGVGRVLADSPYEQTRFNPFGNRMILRRELDLRGFHAAEIAFDLRGVIDGRNYALSVEVRDESDEWNPLSTELFQSDNSRLDGGDKTVLRGEHDVWTRFRLSLDEHVGKVVDLSLRVQTHGESSVDVSPGVLIDNLVVEGSVDQRSGVAGSHGINESRESSVGIVLIRNGNILRTLQTRTASGHTSISATHQLYDALGRLLLENATLVEVAEFMRSAEQGTYSIRTDDDSLTPYRLLLL